MKFQVFFFWGGGTKKKLKVKLISQLIPRKGTYKNLKTPTAFDFERRRGKMVRSGRVGLGRFRSVNWVDGQTGHVSKWVVFKRINRVGLG